jgi:hypothetical protein
MVPAPPCMAMVYFIVPKVRNPGPATSVGRN